MQTFLHGMLISGSLIIAIGAQNAFVLKQGLMKNHIFWVSLICFLCDAILITLGVTGVGTLINRQRWLTLFLSLGGALFLFWYGLRSLRQAYDGNNVLAVESDATQSRSLRSTIVATLAISLLNPHVYLDTVVIIGGIAGTLPTLEKGYFLFGSITVSLVWFFGLGFGARLLIPLFNRAIFWRILDGIIGIIMIAIASQLVLFAINY